MKLCLPIVLGLSFFATDLAAAQTVVKFERNTQPPVDRTTKTKPHNEYKWKQQSPRQRFLKSGAYALADGDYWEAEKQLTSYLLPADRCLRGDITAKSGYCKDMALGQYYLGFALIGQDRAAEAIPLLESAANLYPDKYEFMGALGMTYRTAGQTDKADQIGEHLQALLSKNAKRKTRARIEQALADSQAEF